MIYSIVFLLLAIYFSYKKIENSIIIMFIHNYILLWYFMRYDYGNFSIMGTSGVLYLYSITFIYAINNKNIRTQLLNLFKFYASLLLVFFLLSLYHETSVFSYVYFFRNFFHYFLLYPIMVEVIKKENHQKVINFIFILIVLQIVLTFLQNIIPAVKDAIYITYVQTGGSFEEKVSAYVYSGNSTVGTFIRPALLGNFLAIVAPFFYLLYSYATDISKLKKRLYFVLFVLSVFLIIRTGIRTSFVAFLGCMLLILFIKNFIKNLFFIFSAGISLFLIIPVVIQMMSNYDSKTDQFENPFFRIVSMLSTLLSGDSLVENSTLRRTNNIFDHFKDFFFGNSYTIKTGNSYTGIDSISDAMLGYVFVEFGIVVLILSLFLFTKPVISKFDFSKKSLFSAAFFISVLLQSITDQGFFTAYTSIPFFVILAMIQNFNFFNKKHESSNNNSSLQRS